MYSGSNPRFSKEKRDLTQDLLFFAWLTRFLFDIKLAYIDRRLLDFGV